MSGLTQECERLAIPRPTEIKKRGQAALFGSLELARFGENNHHEILLTLGESIEVNFFGERFTGVIKELDPKLVRRGDRMVAQNKFKTRCPICRNIAAQHHAVDWFAIQRTTHLNSLENKRFSVGIQHITTHSHPVAG